MKTKIEVEVYTTGAIEEDGLVDCIFTHAGNDGQFYGKAHLAHLTAESEADQKTLEELSLVWSKMMEAKTAKAVKASKEGIEDLSDEELLQRFRNARSTHKQALGHAKAERNLEASQRYAREILRRGRDVPPSEDEGEFNGPGAV